MRFLLLPVLALSLAPATAAQPAYVPPHERPLAWDATDLLQHRVQLTDSTYLAFDLPAFLVPSARWERQERHHARCVGGHWTLDALRSVRLYERRGWTRNDRYLVPDQHLFAWHERPLFCVERPTRLRNGDLTPYPGDTLAAVAVRTALDRCAPDGDPGFRCGAPEITDRFTNAQGIEVIGVAVRYIQGYDAEMPEQDAHAIGPFYLAALPSHSDPFVLFMPHRIAGWMPEEAMLRPTEVEFMRRLLRTASFAATGTE